MSVPEIMGMIFSGIRELGLVPYIQAGLLVIVIVGSVAALKRALANA